MKICVCSDSHGNEHAIKQMLRSERPDGLIFLGDGWHDVSEAELPADMPFLSVAGNCDLGCDWPQERLTELFGQRMLLVHGHRQHVKQGLAGLAEYARQAGARVALYGHTHMPSDRELGGVLLLNPGAMKNREERYMVLMQQGGRMLFEYRAIRW